MTIDDIVKFEQANGRPACKEDINHMSALVRFHPKIRLYADQPSSFLTIGQLRSLLFTNPHTREYLVKSITLHPTSEEH